MNDTTPIQSAPANVTVHKGTNIWRWGHIPQTSYSVPLEMCAYPPTASVSNCSPYPHACQGMGDIGDVPATTRDKERGAAQTAPHLPCHAALRDFDRGFLADANCSSSSPLRTAVINVSMTAGTARVDPV
jgi:hypothetical protein